MEAYRANAEAGADLTVPLAVCGLGFLGLPVPTSVPSARTIQRCCMHNSSDGSKNAKVSRRAFFKFAGSSVLISTAGILRNPASAVPDASQTMLSTSSSQGSDGGCRNCQGTGKITCELCTGTGFWRALSGNNPNQRYKGVICPECEGVGRLSCPVCLGTGEGNIKGLLRRRKVEPGPGRILQST